MLIKSFKRFVQKSVFTNPRIIATSVATCPHRSLAGAISGLDWVGIGLDLCVGLFYELFYELFCRAIL